MGVDGQTVLVVDTSYGSTVGIVGREPIVETDSRTHVEQLQVNIARALEEAGLGSNDISCIVTGVGPAPFTGLRAGLVTAKALSFVTGATLIGCNVLEPQHRWNLIRRGESLALQRHVLTLAVNDARRKQLYFELCASVPAGGATEPLISMDIDYPANIVERVNTVVEEYARAINADVMVDVVGHGAGKYAGVFDGLNRLGDIVDESVLDQGAQGLRLFAAEALSNATEVPVEPLYLRRPDAEVPNPLKHVLGHGGTAKANR